MRSLGPHNGRLVTDVRTATMALDARGTWLLHQAAINLAAGERALGVLRLRRAIARGTPRERDLLEPLLERARRAKAT